MNKILNLVFFVLLSTLTLSAKAEVILDTGSPTMASGMSIGNTLSWFQNLGESITVNGKYNITDISSYFRTINSGTLTLSLYDDVNGLPNTQLYSQAFNISQAYLNQSWEGISGLNWVISAGNYWITYEVLKGQTYEGSFDSPISPINTVIENDFYPEWHLVDSGVTVDSFALVVLGEPIAAVPEAEIYLMMLAGLCLIGWVTYRRKTQKT